MASSSNFGFQDTYDIFLSFRGLDTRKKFTDHLYEALTREGFHTFRDDDEIERGENIISKLRKAIENSRMSVIVLSKNYANSTACLFEIQAILEQQKKSDHLILPVFYEVYPWNIKEQAKNLNFGEKKVTVEEVKGWSAALKEVANMAGMVSGNQSNGYEAKFIKEIVGVVRSNLASKDHLELDNKMQNLKRKLEYLSGQENDINAEINSQPWKRPKKEVEVWLKDVQWLKNDMQRFEQEVVGQRNAFSHALLGKHIVKKIQEVTELQEKGRVFDGLLIDELPTGRLLIPPTKDFIKSTKARNLENVWECLMNEEVRHIGVYGMGGVGKTTILKHIHNQLLEEKGKFDNVYWVTVSKAFDVEKLQRDIATVVGVGLHSEDETTRAAKLFSALSRNKKYVLIFDDLWEAFPLERVGIPEPTQSNGCKLVFTTRSFDVCRRMYCSTVKVELLTEKEALTLFLSKANGYDTMLAPEVVEIAAEIAKECACLPLAIVTVATSLRGCKGTREWRNALNELVNSTKDSGESEVFERLRFSYTRLGDKELQDCFLYCSLYPEDHDIPVNTLIEYWMAEELIGEMNSVEAKFDKGHAIIGKLTSSCLLESSTDKSECVRMHDLIRDMAIRITRSSPRFMVKAGEKSQSVTDEDWSEDLDRISFMYTRIREFPSRPPVCPRLTTLLLCYTSVEEFPNSFFNNMLCVKVLDLSSSKLRELPASVFNLENLHALLLENCYSVNEHDLQFLQKLKALKVFKLTQSRIHRLPEGLHKLINLRKLDLSKNILLEASDNPNHILRRLSKLQYLRLDKTHITVSAEDLLCLKQLKVVAVHFHNVQELTRYVTSQQFQGLEKYRLIVGQLRESFQLSRRSVDFGKEVHIFFEAVHLGSGDDQLVLPVNMDFFNLGRIHDVISLSAIPSLKDASRGLHRFEVSFCNGLESIFSSSSFSEDGLISLGTVESLVLSYLPRYRVLFDVIAPPHCIYINLKKLSFTECAIMKNVFPVQFLKKLPNLEILEVLRCNNVEDIIFGEVEMSDRGNHQDDRNSISLPKLKRLILKELPRLKSIYSGVMVCQSIELVEVLECPMLRRLPVSLHKKSDQATTSPALKVIIGEQKWWKSLEWDDPLMKVILQPFYRVLSSLHDSRRGMEDLGSLLRKFRHRLDPRDGAARGLFLATKDESEVISNCSVGTR